MDILSPRNIAFRNSLFVPYHAPLKLGLSANITAIPLPTFYTTNETDLFIFDLFFSVRNPSIRGSSEYLTTDE